jgi:hypothetical protein
LLDQIHFYSPETILLPELATLFGQTGQLTAEGLYLILDWKAARALTRHIRRLTDGPTFSQAAADLARILHSALDD